MKILAAAGFALMGTAGCALAAGSASPLVIGLHAPMTGSVAKVGVATSHGVQVAVDEYNAKHADRQVKLVTVDDASSPQKAVGAVERLAYQNNAVAVIGGYGTGIIGPASQTANNLKLPYLAAFGISQSLIERHLPYFFQAMPIAGYPAAVMGLLNKGFKVHSVAIVHDNSEPGTEISKLTLAGLKKAGVKVAADITYPLSISDLSPVLRRATASHPDVLIQIGYVNQNITALRNLQVVKPKVKALVSYWDMAAPSIIKAVGKYANDAYGTVTWAPGTAPAALHQREQDFIRDYKKKYGGTPGYLAAGGYATANMLLAAIDSAAKSGKVTRASIETALKGLTTETIIGHVKFDSRGANTGYSSIVTQIQNGKLVAVWPKDRAAGNYQYPAVPW